MSGDPLVDFLERTFAESYRKEVEQEENVWRSLPFFAATLALELAALAQIRDWVAGASGTLFVAAAVLLALAALATLAAVGCLTAAIWPADYQFIASELQLRDYAEEVQDRLGRASEPALNALKALLIDQYATVDGNNRIINRRRGRWRTRASLATLLSVFALLVLVALAVITKMLAHAT